MRPGLVVIAVVLLLSGGAKAQTNSDLVLRPWPAGVWGETTDKLLYQSQGHVKGTGDDTQIFWWDSIGRFRLSQSDANTPDIAYRYLTMNFDTSSAVLPQHLDKVSVAGGLHLGEAAGGNVSVVFGAGYSGNNPFADANGIFGVGHLVWVKALAERDELALTLDYDGGGALLPDVPLPGFQFIHRDEVLKYGVGFPRSFLEWAATDRISLSALYEVPFSSDIYVDCKLAGHFGVFGNFADFFEAFQLQDEPRTTRLFDRMRRVEMGVRYHNPDVWHGMELDVALAVGYAFDQELSRGWDVRGLHRLGEISDEPYVALVVRGRF